MYSAGSKSRLSIGSPGVLSPTKGGTTPIRGDLQLASADVLMTSVHHLEQELRRRPVDLGSALMAITAVSAIVKKSISTPSARNGEWSCPDAAAKLFPSLIGFLQYCANYPDVQNATHLRTLELHTVNLCYYLLVAIPPTGALKPIVHHTLVGSLQFFLHAARQQLAAIQVGAIRHGGLHSPSLWEPPEMGLGPDDLLLTECDGYIWLTLCVILKLGHSSVREWLKELTAEPNSEPFTVCLLSIILELFAFYLQRKVTQYCSALAAAMDGGRAAGYSAFPIPALNVEPSVEPDRKELKIPTSVRLTLRRIPIILCPLFELFPTLCAPIAIPGLKVFSSLTWISTLREYVEGRTPESALSPNASFYGRQASSSVAADESGGAALSAQGTGIWTAAPGRSNSNSSRAGDEIEWTPLQHEEQYLLLGDTLAKRATQEVRQIPSVAAQFLRVALLVVLRNGLRDTNSKTVPPTAAALPRTIFDVSVRSLLTPADVELHAALLVEEFLTLRYLCTKLYVEPPASVHRSFSLLQDFVSDTHQSNRQGERSTPTGTASNKALRFGSTAYLSDYSSAVRPELSSTDEGAETHSWRNVVRLAALVLEAESEDGDVLDALWRLVVYYLKLLSVNEDVAFVEPPVGDAAEVLANAGELDWEEYEDRDEVAVAKRLRDIVRLPRTLNSALRFMDTLVVRCLQTGELAIAASYCDSLGELLSHKELTSSVSASLYIGAARLYHFCCAHPEAVRVGLIAVKQLSTLTCDLIEAAEAAELVRKAAAAC